MALQGQKPSKSLCHMIDHDTVFVFLGFLLLFLLLFCLFVVVVVVLLLLLFLFLLSLGGQIFCEKVNPVD